MKQRSCIGRTVSSWAETLRSLGIVVTVALVLPLLFACGGSGESNSGSGNLVQASLYGQVSAGGLPLERMAIAVVDANGRSVVDDVTLSDDSTGAFSVLVTAVEGHPLRIDATVSSGVVLRAEVEQYIPNSYTYVNFLSSLVYAYRQVHKEVPVEVAQARIFDFLGVPAEWRLKNEPVNPELSLVSGRAFMSLAWSDGSGFDHYLSARVVPRIDAGETVSLRDDTSLVWEALDSELNYRVVSGRTPGVKLSQEVEQAFIGRQGASPSETYITSVISALSSISGVVMKGIAMYRDHDSLKTLNESLERVERALADLKMQIEKLEIWLTRRFDQVEYTVMANQISSSLNRIASAYDKLVKINVLARAKNLTDLDATLQSLYQETPDNIYESARNIHRTQWIGDTLTGGMANKARAIVGANGFNGDQTRRDFDQQILNYAGSQTQAVSLIASLGQPGLKYSSTDPYDLTYTFASSDAGSRNQSNLQIDEIVNNIRRQRSLVPRPLPGVDHVHDVVTDVVYHRASLNEGSGGGKYRYVTNYTAGGLTGWVIADRQRLVELFRTAGGRQNLNQAVGFQLRPARVEFLQQRMAQSCPYPAEAATETSESASHTWWRCGNGGVCKCWWESDGRKTATESGFLTVDVTSSGLEYGWVDDAGRSGRIGTGGNGNPPADLDSDRSVFVKYGSNYKEHEVWCGQINGPVILMNKLESANVQTPAAAVALGRYSGLSVRRVAALDFVPDTLSGGSSGTERLVALPRRLADGPSTAGQDLSTEVYWEALDSMTGAAVDPSIATISNLQPSSTPPAPEFAMPRIGSGMIHWQAASYGKQLTFRATLSRPNGTRISDEVTLTSPVAKAQALPDALDVFPPYIQTTSQRLADKPIQLYATRHWPQGWFENVTGRVSYTSSHPGVTVSASGLVRRAATANLPAGTIVTITATDPAIKAQSGFAIRPVDTSRILID